MQKTPENCFTAKQCNFQGVSGYMVEQYLCGVVICSQFVSKNDFNEFCKQTKIAPLIVSI